MDTSNVADLFNKTVRSLDQTTSLDCKLDQLMGRLDDVINILESQKQKQNLLEVKLSEMTSKLEEEKILIDQLRKSQDEILDSLRYLKTQPEGALPVSKSGLSVAGEDLYQPTGSRSDWNDGINGIKDQFEILNQKTDPMSSQIIETAETCNKLAKSTNEIEIQFFETSAERDQERERVKACLDEIIHLPEVVRSQAKAELALLRNQIDKKWTSVVDQQKKQVDLQVQQYQACKDLKTKVYKLMSDMESELDALKDIVPKNIHTTPEKDKINSKCISKVISNLVLNRFDEVNRQLERCIETVIRVAGTAKEDLIKALTNSEGTQTTQALKLQRDIKDVIVSITFLDGHLKAVGNSMVTVVQKIDGVGTSLNAGQKAVKEDLLSLKKGQDLVTTRIEQSTNAVQNYICSCARAIVAVTEKEAQIVRDRIEGPLPSLGKYSFDLYLLDFKSSVRSGRCYYSLPWHINEANTSMAGWVLFQEDGNILVWFIHGRHPREVGLQPRVARRLKVKATICDVCNKVLPDIVVGERTGDMYETGIPGNRFSGQSLGVTSCDILINKGYGQKEGYEWGAILVRFDVTVL